MGVIESIRLTKKEVNPGLAVYGIVLNKFTWRARLSTQVSEMANKMAAALKSRVFKTKIRQGVAMSENVGQHIGITAYDPKGKCAEDIKDLCKEIEEACQ